MRTKSLIIPAMMIFLLVFVSAASVTTSLFYDATTGDSLTINNGETFGLSISADSIFESEMNVVLNLKDSSGNVIVNILDVTTTSDSYSNHLTISQSSYAGPGNYVLASTVTAPDGQTDTDELYLEVLAPTPSNNAPVITSTPITSVNENQFYSYDVGATDSDGDTLTYSLTQKPSWLSINTNTGLITGTAPEVDSDYAFAVTVQVSDGINNVMQSYALTVYNVVSPPQGNNAPVITSTPITSVNENTNYAYDVQATDGDGDTLTYSLTQAPNWLSINSVTGLISGVAPTVSANTNYAITVVVSDGKIGTSQSYTLTVLNVVTPPTNNAPVANNQNIVMNENTNIAITLSATDADGNVLTYSIVSNPSNGAISNFNANTGTLTYTPNANFVGSDSFTFRANDGQANSNIATVSITVNDVPGPANNPPVITSTPITSVNENTAYNYQVAANDPEGNALTYSISGPAWLSISNTGLVSGTAPGVSSDTTFSVTITVSDGTATVNQAYILTVRDISDGGPSGRRASKKGGGGVKFITDSFYDEKYFDQFEPAMPIILEEEKPAEAKAFELKNVIFWFFVLVLILIILAFIIWMFGKI